MSDWANDLLEYHLSTASRKTSVQYAYDLRVMQRFLDHAGHPVAGNIGVVEYIAGLCLDDQPAQVTLRMKQFEVWALGGGRQDGTGFTPSSVRRVESSVRKLLTNAEDLRVLRPEQIPRIRLIDHAPPIRNVKAPPRIIIERMIGQSQRRGDAKGLRDELALWLMFANALRLSEVRSIQYPKGVDLEAGEVTIRPKGGLQGQIIQLPRETARVLSAYVEARGTREGPLIASENRSANGEGISDTGLRMVVQNLAKAVEAPKRVNPHMLRHAGITEIGRLTNHNAMWICLLSRHRTPDLIAREQKIMWLRYEDDPQFCHREAANIVQRGRPWRNPTTR